MCHIKKIVTVCLFGLSSIASASTFTFSGNFVNQTDVARIDFSIASNTTNVRVWTDSFMANATNPSGTNFDPITALWNTSTGALISQNDDNSAINPATQTFFDSGFSLATLAAGDYFFTVAAFNNFAAGSNISNGFSFDGQTPIAIGLFNQPSNANNARGSFWRVNLDGVDTATGPVDPNPSAVPVPGAVWLFGTAIAGFAGFGRRKTV